MTLQTSLKILFLSHNFYPFIGGIETISFLLAKAFTEQGHKVHLLTWSPDSSNKTFPFTVIRQPGLNVLFREHRWADVVFENNPCLRLSWPAVFFHKPSVIGLQTWLRAEKESGGLQGWVKFKWLSRAGKVIACSDAIRNACWPDATVIANPYDESLFEEHLVPARTFDFVFVGRLVSDKGADLAIRAFHQLISFDNNEVGALSSTLTIIGDGPQLEMLKEMVEVLRLSRQVTFTGSLRGMELVNCLNKHRFLLVPSLWEEPFGIVALEGLACGCVPIVSDGGGLPATIGDAGLTFKRGDVNSLVECMRKVLCNNALTSRLRKAAAMQLKAHHCRDVSKKYLEVIAESVN